MISVRFTYDEVQALVGFIWGEESDREALRTANDKLTAALDPETWTAGVGSLQAEPRLPGFPLPRWPHSGRRVAGQEGPACRHNMASISGNKLLVFGCGCNVSGTYRNSAAEGGQLPGLPEERMPAGLVLIHGRAHGARIAAQPAEAAGARCTPPGQIAGLAAANAAAVTR